MSMKTIAALCVMVAAAGAATAKPVSPPPPPPPAPPVANPVGGIYSIAGFVGTGTDYFAQGNAGGTVVFNVPNTLPSGSYDVFTDVYNFSTAGDTQVTGIASTPRANKNFSLAGGTGELMLYEGTYHIGTAFSSYALEGTTSFTTAAAASLVKVLDEGNYFFVLEGTTSGAQGGKYSFEVQGLTLASAVPETGSTTLMLGGVAVLGLALRRKAA